MGDIFVLTWLDNTLFCLSDINLRLTNCHVFSLTYIQVIICLWYFYLRLLDW